MKTVTTTLKWYIPAMLFSLFIFSSCNNKKEEHRKKCLEEMNKYVKERKNAPDKYAGLELEKMEKEFGKIREKSEEEYEGMSEEMKSDYRRTLAEWDSFKADYLAIQKTSMKRERSERLKRTVFPKLVTFDLDNITDSNIVHVYEHFVSVVKANKDSYTSDEWVVVNDAWKSLNEKEEEYDKQISADDLKKIMKLKLEYTGIKIMNKRSAALY